MTKILIKLLPFFCRKLRFGKRGSILILVVWTISFLSLLAVYIGFRSLFSIGLSSRFQDDLKMQYVARSAVRYAAGIIVKDETQDFDGTRELWFNDEYKFRSQSFHDGEFTISNLSPDDGANTFSTRYGLLDEDRKMNINFANADMLRGLFEVVAGLDQGPAKSLADSILDWRDEDSNRRPFGAEKFDYMAGKYSYQCPDALFESVEELQLIEGMTPEIYNKIEPYVTVFGSGQINLNTVSPALLYALGISESATNYIYANRLGGDGIIGTEDDAIYNSAAAVISSVSDSIPIEDVTKLSELNAAKVFGVKSEAYKFLIESRVGHNDKSLLIDCVINKKGTILSWFEH